MTKRLKHIDALRGLAALAIILFHLVWIPNPNLPVPSYLSFIPNRFGLGVPMFFIISGYSIFLSLDSKKSKHGWIFQFFARRFFRIAPLFYFMFCFYFVRGALHGNITSFLNILINISFSYTFFPGKHESLVWAGWPISIEMVFYLTVPLLIKFVDSFKKSIALLILSIILTVSFRYFLKTIGSIPPTYYYMNIFTHLPFLSLGIMAFFLNQKKSIGQKAGINNLTMFLAILLTILILFSFKYTPISNRLKFYEKYCIGLILSLLLVLLGNIKLKFIVNRLTQFLGKISYSLYLAHPFIIYSLSPLYKEIYKNINNVLLSFTICILITIPLIFFTACFLYYFIENPVRKFSYLKMGQYIDKQ